MTLILVFVRVVFLAWLLVFGESLEDCIRGYGLGVIEMVACFKFCVDMVSFNRV